MFKSRIAAGAALLVVAGAAAAGSFTVTPTITNDYDFRGFTQTQEDPAVQLGATYAFDNGFYLGAWGSNVDYGPGDPSVEVDYYGGFASSTDSFGYDVGLIYYTYNGAKDANTLEAYASITKDWLNGKLSFTNDAASSKDSAFYAEANVAYPLPQNFSLLAHAGYGFGDAYSDEVFDYSAGLGYSLQKFNLAVKYVDTDVSGLDGRVVATISTTFPWGE